MGESCNLMKWYSKEIKKRQLVPCFQVSCMFVEKELDGVRTAN